MSFYKYLVPTPTSILDQGDFWSKGPPETLIDMEDYNPPDFTPTPNGSRFPNLAENAIELDEPTESFNPLDFLEASSVSETFTVPSMVGGQVLSAANREVSNYSTSQNLLNAQKGNGPEGHAFYAVTDAQIENNFQNRLTDVENLEITAGSLFGPEGLALGAGAAVATDLIGQNFAPSNTGYDNGINTTTPNGSDINI